MPSRILEPEILDHLDHRDPAAIQSRQELALINTIMGNHRWLRSTLRRHLNPGTSVLEIGAGDGGFLMSLMDAGLCRAEQVHAMDLVPAPAHWPQSAHWHKQSVLDGVNWPQVDIVVCNLFLHHFDESALSLIGAAASRARVIIACEPARRTLHIVQGALLAALADFGHVTGNDMLVSIRAGFSGDELPAAMRLQGSWQHHTSSTLLGAYRWTATRSCDLSP